MRSIPDDFRVILTKNSFQKRGCKKCIHLGTARLVTFVPTNEERWVVICDTTTTRTCTFNEEDRIMNRYW